MDKLKDLDQFKELRDSGKTVFVFMTGWCPDCHYIRPFMPEVENKFTDFRFVEIDRDDFGTLGEALQISGIPSFVVYAEGEPLGRFVSRNRKTQKEIEAFLEQL